MKKEGEIIIYLFCNSQNDIKLETYSWILLFTEVQNIFLNILREEEDVSAGVAAIKTLLTVIETYKGNFIFQCDFHRSNLCSSI